jgi:hypothetical protein
MSQNSSNQGFSYYFCLMIEGSGAGTGSGSICRTNGSGARRPKNIGDHLDPDPQHRFIIKKNSVLFYVVECRFYGRRNASISEFHLKAYHQEEIFSGSGLKIHQPEKDESGVVGSE